MRNYLKTFTQLWKQNWSLDIRYFCSPIERNKQTFGHLNEAFNFHIFHEKRKKKNERGHSFCRGVTFFRLFLENMMSTETGGLTAEFEYLMSTETGGLTARFEYRMSINKLRSKFELIYTWDLLLHQFRELFLLGISYRMCLTLEKSKILSFRGCFPKNSCFGNEKKHIQLDKTKKNSSQRKTKFRFLRFKISKRK